MQRSEEKFLGQSGLELYSQSWQPDNGKKAALVVVHGVAEYSNRYQNLAESLVNQGYAIYTYDQRGHGKSEGQRGFINDWSEYREDFITFLVWVREREPNLPLFAYGHSMGALVILDYLLNDDNRIIGSILSGTPLETSKSASPLLIITAQILSRFLPTFSLPTPINPAQLSCDARVVQSYQDDPTVFKILTARWGTEYLKTQKFVYQHAESIVSPVFIIHGGEDKLCDPQGSQDLYHRISSKDKLIKIYPAYFHEIHNEPGKASVLQDIADWMESHLVKV